MTVPFAGFQVCVTLITLSIMIALAEAQTRESPATVPTSRPTTREASDPITRELEAVIEEMLADSSFRARAPSTRPAVPNESPRDRARREADELLALAEDRSVLRENRHAPALPRAFDDASNRQFMHRARQAFQDFSFKHADVVDYLLRRDREQPLTGTRLELLARLSTGSLEQLARILSSPRR